MNLKKLALKIGDDYEVKYGNIQNRDKGDNIFTEFLKKFAGEKEPTGETAGTLFSHILPYVFIIAGLMFTVMFIAGGFQLLMSGGNPQNVESGQKKISAAFVGFIIIFVAFWIIRLLEIMLGAELL